LGPIDSTAKTFTVRRYVVKLVEFIFWMTDEHTSSKLEKMLIQEGEEEGECCT
jgi:hypothetical protein